MPEGDTIHTLAGRMGPRITGRIAQTVHLRDRGAAPVLVDRTVVRVGALGKHLLIDFAGGATLRSHLGMKGRWHGYAAGERWERSPAAATAVVDFGDEVYVCFRGPDVELFETRHLARHPRLSTLGPDLLGPDIDIDHVVDRCGRRPDATVADALLDQRIAAGLGNVFKSEICFMRRLDPWSRVGSMERSEVAATWSLGRELLQRSVALGSRVTTGGAEVLRRGGAPRLWVYRRSGRPCLRCGTPLRAERQGDMARNTYWCPACQPATLPP